MVAAMAALSESCDLGAEGLPSLMGSSWSWLRWALAWEPEARGSPFRAGCCEEDREERRQEEDRPEAAAPAA